MSNELTYFGAALAGLLSFLSPCVLPLVPPYLSFLAGTTAENVTDESETEAQAYQNVVLAAFFFVLGFTTIFVALGATATTLGQFLRDHLDLLAKIGGVIIIIFGLHFLGLFKIPLLYRDTRYHVHNKPAGVFGAYVLGLAFASGWTPCIGPILAPILGLAANAETITTGISFLLVYSLGLGIPFILAAIAIGPFMTFFKRFKRHLRYIEKIMGVFLILTGILFITGSLTIIAGWIQDWFPALTKLG